MANQWQQMIRCLDQQTRQANEAAQRCKQPEPGSKQASVHPVVQLHCHPSRVRHDPPNLSLRRR
jgi:hypothetical protein